MKEYKMFVNGEYTDASSSTLRDDINPATGEVYARIHQATREDATKAIDAAEQAFGTWKNTAPAVRERIMLRAADIMEERAEALKTILMEEGGAAALKAGYEAHHTPDFIRSMAGEARRIMGQTYQSSMDGVFSYSIRMPLGIVSAIAPFNFPLLLGTRKIGWALAAGNCVVLKPSDYTPVIGLMLGEIFHEAGLPAGVFNVVTGRGSVIGDTLIDDPRVAFVTFTGSSEVGKQVGARCALNNKKYALEMGGKNPVIILNDADLDYAVDVATFSNFMHQGQVCMTGSRVIVEEGIYDAFIDKFAAKVATLKTGNPMDPGVIIGPLIDPGQSPFIKGLIDDAVSAGARVLTGGDYEWALFPAHGSGGCDPGYGHFSNGMLWPGRRRGQSRGLQSGPGTGQ